MPTDCPTTCWGSTPARRPSEIKSGLPPPGPGPAPRRQPRRPRRRGRLQEVALAYEVLSDPTSAGTTMFRPDGVGGAAADPFGGPSGGLGDIFDVLRWGGARLAVGGHGPLRARPWRRPGDPRPAGLRGAVFGTEAGSTSAPRCRARRAGPRALGRAPRPRPAPSATASGRSAACASRSSARWSAPRRAPLRWPRRGRHLAVATAGARRVVREKTYPSTSRRRRPGAPRPPDRAGAAIRAAAGWATCTCTSRCHRTRASGGTATTSPTSSTCRPSRPRSACTSTSETARRG